jgi:phytol kinase
VNPPGTLVSSPAVGLAIVLGLMTLILVGVRLFQVVAKPHPELARKMFHAGAGIVAAGLPWLCADTWPVVAIGIASAAGLLLLRAVPTLRASIGEVLGGVRRDSEGEFFFLASVVVVFVLSGRRPALYVPPVLVLALADTSAALVGVGYGRVHFPTVEGGRKSAEGSLAFLLTAFLCVHVPLLVWSATGRIESLVIAFNVALLAMMAEAIAWRGLDNFFIPFFGYALLRGYLSMPAWRLGVHAGVIVSLFVFVYILRRRTTLAANARLGGVLFGYITWVLAGWVWLVPPVLLFSTYRALSRRVPLDATRHINLFTIASVLLPPLGWVVFQWLFPTSGLYQAFVTMFATHLGLVALVRDAHALPAMRGPALVLASVARGALLLVPSTLIVDGLSRAAALHVGLGLGAIALASIAFTLAQPSLKRYPLDAARWARQAACASAASLGAWVLAQVTG